MNAFEILAYGGQVTAIGLLTVFVALIIIIACVYALSAIIRLFVGGAEKKAEKSAPAPAPAPAAAPVTETAPAAEAESEAEEEEYVADPQIIAVIAAAIAASDANTRLVVRSVKRVSGWNRAARNESVSRF
jgi:Na+-transporting methylmalonyl-CoA/oxaloacetate decarboxylase gamma subunit